MRGWLVETPVLESEAINGRVGARVLFKAECLQHTGSFKIRGALNRLLQLSADERAAGVVAFSSGNHAQAVALAARWLGDSRNDRDAGRCAQGEARAHARARRGGRALRSRARGPGGDRRPASPSGAAPRSCRLSITRTSSRGRARSRSSSRAQRARGTPRIDAFYAPCSGGGLVAGCALALKAEWPSCAVYAVEPRGFEDHGGVVGRRRSGARSRPEERRCATGCARRRRARSRSRSIGAFSRALSPSMTRRFAPPWRSRRSISKSSSSLRARPRSRRCSRSRGRAGACVAVVLSGGNVDAEICSPTCCRARSARMRAPAAARNST